MGRDPSTGKLLLRRWPYSQMATICLLPQDAEKPMDVHTKDFRKIDK